jgi:hypothetical protein
VPNTTLHSSQNQQPNGLLLIPEFVNEIAEAELIEFIERELLKRHEETGYYYEKISNNFTSIFSRAL